MRIEPNLQLKNYLLEQAVQEHLSGERQFPHVTECIYCLTKSWFKRMDSLPLTEDAIVKFSTGWVLEKVYISNLHTEMMCCDGIFLSPDFMHYAGPGTYGELKSTRMRAPKASDSPDFPETWLEQMMAYAHTVDRLEWDIAVIYLIPAVVLAWRLYFTEEEVHQNWVNILERKEVLSDHIKELKPPAPFAWCKKWECGYGCEYKMRCEAISRGLEYAIGQ